MLIPWLQTQMTPPMKAISSNAVTSDAQRVSSPTMSSTPAATSTTGRMYDSIRDRSQPTS